MFSPAAALAGIRGSASGDGSRVMASGWLTKKGEKNMLGQHNWARRWFELTASAAGATALTYFEGRDEQTNRGKVQKGEIDLRAATVAQASRSERAKEHEIELVCCHCPAA